MESVYFNGRLLVRGLDFELDCADQITFPGDYICIGIGRSKRVNRRVKQIRPGSFVVKDVDGSDDYVLREYAVRSGRYHPYHHGGVDKRRPRDKYLTPTEKEPTEMLHLAIRVPATWGYQDLANSINNFEFGRKQGEGAPITDMTIAATSTTELKQRVTDRIRANPDERWLLVSGNNIMEIDSPPVRCRQW